MINIGKILRRAWFILWNYRILWIFGILLALTSGGFNGPDNNGGDSQTPRTNGGLPGMLPENTPDWARQFTQWFMQNVQPVFSDPLGHIGTILAILGIVLLVILVISALASIVRYPTETAVIRMVDEYERSGSKMGFRQGWRLGWDRRAFRLWLIDLILAIPILVFVLLIAAAGLIVAFSVSSTFQVTNVAGVVAAIGLAFISIFLLVAVALFLGLVRNFFARAVVLEGLDVSTSLRQGWAMFKRNWKSAGLVWLVMVGLRIGIGILGTIVFFLLIPAYLVMLIPAIFVAILPGLAAFTITSLFTSGPLAWLIGILAAAPFFFAILFVPLFLFMGWYLLYESSTWTLSYREIQSLETLAPPSLPVEGAPSAA